jgi:predicted Fe-Mo cluster-binding NifX family protein
MIAIPVDNINPDVKSSTLFGNVNYFALYSPASQNFSFIHNTARGDGIKTAELLKTYSATKVFYSYMGNGPFGTLQENDIDVYYLGKESLDLDEIINSYDEDAFIKVTKNNAKTYLDPGTQTGECTCT